MIDKNNIKEIFKYRSDGCLIWKIDNKSIKKGMVSGCIDSKGYFVTTFKRKLYKTHRLIFLYHNGYLPVIVDHVDGDHSNNKIENLQEANNSQNVAKSKTYSTNTSGVKGVHLSNGKWMARICCNGKRIYLGSFESIEDAKAVRVEAENKYFGKFIPVDRVS